MISKLDIEIAGVEKLKKLNFVPKPFYVIYLYYKLFYN